MTLTRILAPVGEFPQDDAVLGRALEIAAMHHAALVIVHVMDLPGEECDIARPDTLLGQAAVAARGARAPPECATPGECFARSVGRRRRTRW